jgi:hypothetical protein
MNIGMKLISDKNGFIVCQYTYAINEMRNICASPANTPNGAPPPGPPDHA